MPIDKFSVYFDFEPGPGCGMLELSALPKGLRRWWRGLNGRNASARAPGGDFYYLRFSALHDA